jgi:hypothetical protein
MTVHVRYHLSGALVLALVVAALPARPVSAQSLVEMYRSARFRVQAEQLLGHFGDRTFPRPLAHLPYATDSVRSQMAVLLPPDEPEAPTVEVPPVRIVKRSLTPKLASNWFEEKFEDTHWSYLGSNELAAYDTTFTRELRARMEAHFGAPTRTIAEQPSDVETSAEYIQFQYWFVLNDSIPLIVMDTNGPFERGLVVATDRSYRSMLPDLKRTLLTPVIESPLRAPYVDYYYLQEQDLWFLTGFDGERFVLDRVSRPNLRMGRPLISTLRER